MTLAGAVLHGIAVGPVTLAAYRPFLEPLRLDSYWLLLMLPLVIAISMAYKAIKLDNLAYLPREAAFLAVQIMAFMAMAAASLWLLTELV
jgi:hypothetical protein